MKRRALRTKAELDPDSNLLLADACEIYFDGVLSPASLRREAKRGNLRINRIAGRDFVQPRDIEAMIDKCRVPSSLPALSSVPTVRPQPNEKLASNDGSGSSKTATGMSERDARKAKLRQLKEGFPSTSAKSTNRSEPAAKLLTFPSETS